LLVAVVGLSLHYNLPRTDVVRITGTDVKRIDREGKNQASKTRDVRYINSVTRSGKVKVFRNEDTGWGWPPYFKFDSADQTALAQSIMQNSENLWVRVRYYGWRMQVFSLFPNAISIKVVDEDYTHIPVFNIVFFILLGIGGFFLVKLVRSLKQRFSQKLNRHNDIKKYSIVVSGELQAQGNVI
jgi:hypothetical protein